MTKYVLPVFKKVGQEYNLEYEVDEILYRHGFAKISEFSQGGRNEGSIWRYSTDGVGRDDAEMYIFPEPAKISIYPAQEQRELWALVIFHNVSEETYSKIESAVNDQLHRAHK